MRGHRILCLMLCAFLFGLLLPSLVHAEAPLQEFSLIEPLDAAKFPNVTLRVAPILADGTAPEGVAQGAFRLEEDRTPREIASVRAVTVGAQVALIVHAAKTNFDLGATGKVLKDEYCEAVRELVSGQWLSQAEPKDQMMLIMPEPESQEFKVLEPWTTDLMRIYNATVTYPYDKKKEHTLLYGMLVEAIRRMKDLPNYAQRPKFVLIFSDRFDMLDAWGQVDDVIARANEAKVIIISIAHGPKGTVCGDKMKRLCIRTGGMCVWYENLGAMSVPYNLLKLRRGQYELSYRSALCQSGKHEVRVIMQYKGRELPATGTVVVPALPAPSVRIVEPAANTRITREAPPCYRGDLKVVGPTEQAITYEATWTWPDGSARQVTKVSYIVDGVIMATLPPDQQYVWDISASKPGVEKHSLQVRVADECGAGGESEPVQVEVETIIDEFKPPQASIVDPRADSEIKREAPWYANPKNAKPKDVTIKWTLTFPDGCDQRGISQVSYYVDGILRDKLPPDQPYKWDFSDDAPGKNTPHSLQVEVLDEWGFSGKSEAVKVVIVTPKGPPDLGKIIAVVFAALALGVAVYVGIKRPQVVQAIGHTMAGAYDKTVGRLIPRKPGQPRGAVAARAHLVPILSDGSEGQPIAIRFFPSLVGRDVTRCQITFSDPTVSRLHARIMEEADGVFKICDEGSTGGTYVNGQEVGVEGFVLAHNDRIELGNLMLIFRLPEEGTRPVGERSSSTDTTVASRKGRRASSREVKEAEEVAPPEEAKPAPTEGEDSTVPYLKKD